MNFYAWVEVHVTYRYDEENHPEGKQELALGHITEAHLGDGRSGTDYWQRPAETYQERYGDCEDMVIMELAFYTHCKIESYMGLVDVDGNGAIDHAICIVWFSEEAYQWLVQYQGIVEYYRE